MHRIANQNVAHATRTFGRFRLLLVVLPLVLVALMGCQSAQPSGQTPAQADVATADIAVTVDATDTADPTVDPATDGEIVTAPVTSTVGTTSEEVAAETVGAEPIRMAIPAIDFVAEIEPMAWRVTEVDGSRQAVWEVPENSAGWHINSATPGTAGNMILSGHHLAGAAVFAPLARGEVALGDQVLVTDASGKTFVYQVSEVADPIPVSGATEAERERMDRYYAQTDQPTLTLITGWPDFSDTHYLFIIADFIGELE
ncbi:MAG: class F sortase [Caldilineaceae bacterium]|nr:class F sortase [Caldilineaceae bacterium]